MPESNNPKFPERPADVHQDADSPEGRDLKGDDPLVELARIVSGRSATTGGSAGAKKSAPAQEPAAQPATTRPFPSESDLARDLEEELLNELQASFSMVPEVAPRPSPAPQPPQAEPSAPIPEFPPPPEPPSSSAAQQAPPPPRAEPAQPAPPPEFPPARAAPSSHAAPPQNGPTEPDMSSLPPEAPPPAEPRAEAPPSNSAPQPAPQRRSPRIFQGQAGSDTAPDRLEGWLAQQPAPPKRPTLADRIAQAARKAERAAPPARAEASSPAPEPARQPPAPKRQRETEFVEDTPHRAPPAPSQTAAEPDTPAPRRPRSRWDLPADLDSEFQPPIDAARFAPAAADEFRLPQNEAPIAEPDALADEFSFPEGNDVGYDDDAEDYDTVPGYDDDAELLAAYPDDNLAEPPRSRRGPLAVAALIAIAVVVGGVIMIILRSGGADDTPRVISADASPTKITPDNAGASEGDGQSKLIYDRVDPNSEVADSQLVVPGNEPIADIPPIPDETSGSEVSRVILEGGPAVDPPSVDAATPSQPAAAPQENGGTTIASGDPNSAPIGPKKVRTVVVRPDGTIVSSEAADADASAPMAEPRNSQEPQIADLPPASETPPAPAADENPLLADDFGADVSEGSVPDAPLETSTSPSVPDVPAPAPVVRPPPPNPTVVATPGSTNGPIDVTPGTRAPSSTRSAGTGGGYLVQVSSQRSREVALATFAELQQRYPGILGDRAPDIQRADLGERGVYYRVRVGYPTRAEAIRMCENLKAAGGDCLLATR